MDQHLSWGKAYIVSAGIHFVIFLLLAIGLAVVVAVSIQWVGILIINALLVLPGAAARNIARSVTLIHRRDTFRAEKIMVEKLMKRVDEGKIILKTNAQLAEILGDDAGVTGAHLQNNDGSSEDIAVKGVFIAIGHQPNTEIFKGQLDMDATGYLITRGGNDGNTGATNVDGVYTADPKKDASATRYQDITFDEAIVKNLKVMDATALALCRERKLNIVVFGIAKEGALKRVVLGEDEGTLVHN